ncbi:MAG: hypothetical protein JRE40_14255 [Deltaproteobacteria bacterium]|nr:hypothetical protein [Deltaproteobacteria bacterium]
MALLVALAGMQERARLVGADLEVTSEPRGGTKVAVTIPLIVSLCN